MTENPSNKTSNLNSTNFLVTIYHQDNYSYQGVIQWLDSGKKVSFRSQLELFSLIQSAVSSNTHTNATLRTWDDDSTIRVVQ